jgi:DNA-binding winged helix-turn-helix (wHTH) protein
VLVVRANHLLTKRDLLERVWPDVFIEESILTVHVAQVAAVVLAAAAG